MNTSNMLLAASISTLFLLSACKEAENPPLENESELITAVSLTFVNQADLTDSVAFFFRDPDGPGGSDPVQFDTIRLDATTEYWMTVGLLDESSLPNIDIAAEVEEEGTDHQLFFTSMPADLLDVVYDDTDADGAPIGLSNTAGTGMAGTGTFQVVLKHQPGIKDGNSTTGETDVEVLFVLEVL